MPGEVSPNVQFAVETTDLRSMPNLVDRPTTCRYNGIMVDKRQRFFIYDRREMLILFSLAVMVAVFGFTLGIHLGKKQGFVTGRVAQSGNTSTVDTGEDHIPGNLELNEQRKDVKPAQDEALKQELQAEVAKTGVKLDQQIQIELPAKAASPKGGATSGDTAKKQAQKKPVEEDVSPALKRLAPRGKFTLQVGSYPSLKEAITQMNELETAGLTPFIRKAEVKGKGDYFRIYFGGFETMEEAKVSGSQYVAKNLIDSYLVIKMP